MKAFQDNSFVFDSYTFNPDSGEAVFRYKIDETVFDETLVFPVADMVQVNDDDLDRALFNLHLVTGLSYWKMLCPKNITINSGTLTRTQAHFWNMIYTKGLGEFYYKNDIDYRDQVHFPYDASLSEPEITGSDELTGEVMTPIGGGKDSIVTAELLKKQGIKPSLFAVQDAESIRLTSEEIGGDRLIVSRKISPTLIEWNKDATREVFNGHVPISAIWSFISVVTATLHEKSDVIFSWESSASEGNLVYLGEEINHQWSKSIEYERALQQYLGSYVTKSVRVFSILRPLSEFHIIKLFAKLPQYFPIFSSCNRNFTQAAIASGRKTYWCGDCAKCAFIFVLLSAWLEHDEVVKIVGHDMFEDETQIELFKELLGCSGNKPFECVGEASEVAAAFELAYRRGDANDTVAMQMFVGEVRDTLGSMEDRDKIISDLLVVSRDNAIPKDYRTNLEYEL
jgi:UDP-N-acetyl-alpha-D-muramoyl-L-alanyl-L-glutamate epimerase